MSNTDAVTPSTSTDVLIGRVKWFNNKAGYGFITVMNGANVGTDVFVHHSGINVENQQYRYLVQGEYVNFVLVKTDSDKHEYQASCVNGVNKGKLMCETRHEFKMARSVYKTSKSPSSTERQPAPKSRGQGPRESEESVWGQVPSDWKQVTQRKTTEKPSSRQRKSHAQ
jgi:cold shock CspA family protein